MKKRIFCRLKRCLRDFKTKDHLCLFLDLLYFEMYFQNGLSCPPSVGLGLFLFVFVFFILFWASLYWFLFFFCSKFFWILWIFLHAPKLCLGTFDDWEFSFMPPSIVWAFSIVEVFSVSRTCLLVWGVVLVKVISKKHYQAQKVIAKDIFQPRERIIKDGLSSSQMHAFRSGKSCFHVSIQSDCSLFIQIKLSFWVTS